MHPTSSCIQRSGENQVVGNMGVSGALSSSLPVMPTIEEKYPKLPDSLQTLSERESMRNPISPRRIPLVSNSETVGHLISSASRPVTDLHFSPLSFQERHSQNYPFISKSIRDGASLQPTQSSNIVDVLSTALLDDYPSENNDVSWGGDSLQDFIDFPENVPAQNGQVESSSALMESEEHPKRTDLREWADQLITVDDALESNWSEIFDDVNVPELEPKVCSETQNKIKSICVAHFPNVGMHFFRVYLISLIFQGRC